MTSFQIQDSKRLTPHLCYVAELNSLGLHVHSVHAGSPSLLPIDDPDPAQEYFWADYKDSTLHLHYLQYGKMEVFYNDRQ